MQAGSKQLEVPIYVLNRDDALDRLVAIWADAERLGLRIERVGQTPTDDPARDQLSIHVDAWSRIANGGSRFAIVLEDDVGLDERLLPLLDTTRLAGELRGDQVLNLDGGPSDPPGSTRIIDAKQPPVSFGAYLLGRDVAERLHALVEGAQSIDEFFANLPEHDVQILVATPPPVAGALSATTEPDEGPWLTRMWRRLKGRDLEEVRPDHSVEREMAVPAIPLGVVAQD